MPINISQHLKLKNDTLHGIGFSKGGGGFFFSVKNYSEYFALNQSVDNIDTNSLNSITYVFFLESKKSMYEIFAEHLEDIPSGTEFAICYEADKEIDRKLLLSKQDFFKFKLDNELKRSKDKGKEFSMIKATKSG